MTNDEVAALVRLIYGQPQFAHYTVTADNVAAYQDELSDLPITGEVAKAAVREMLRDDDQRLPTPQAIRRRILHEAGVLAPPWHEALELIGEWQRAVASDQPPPLLPGPVHAALRARGSGGDDGQWTAQMRQTYEGFAREHDRVVMGPNGLAILAEVVEWKRALAAREELMERARRAVVVLTPPFEPLTLPSRDTPDHILQLLVDKAEQEHGPLDQLDEPTVDRSTELRALLERFDG